MKMTNRTRTIIKLCFVIIIFSIGFCEHPNKYHNKSTSNGKTTYDHFQNNRSYRNKNNSRIKKIDNLKLANKQLELLQSLSPRDSSVIISGVVLNVLDGDTIEILHNDLIYRIRLDGIDCPEKGQSYGSASKQVTSDLCYNKQVDAEILDIDSYGRFLAKVKLPNGIILNEELLRKGYAWHYKKYNNDIRYAVLEDSTRYGKNGLWVSQNNIPPWEFRNGPDNFILPEGVKYVASRYSKKYHLPSCKWAKKISQDNVIYFTTKEEAEDKGYKPCKVCIQ